MARTVETRVQARPLVPVERWSTDFVVDLLENFDAYMRMDIAASSQRTYDAAVRRYLRFCQRLEAPMLPEPTLVSVFIVGCARANYALSTIRVSVAAIQRWAADDYGMPDIGRHPCVVRAMKVASRMAVLSKRQKLPLSKAQLVRVLAHLAQDTSFINVRDAALFQVGWAGMFRSSELVGLQWEHVHFPGRGGVMLYVPQSKTDPGEGAWVMLAAGQGAVDPAGALRRLQALCGGVSASGPVFLARADGVKPLCKTTVAIRLRKALERVGVEHWSAYAAHSLRRGGATHAAAQGVPLRYIMLLGRWKSDVVREYVYYTPTQVLHASRLMLE